MNMTVVLGFIFGLIVVGTFAITLVIVIKGERKLDEPEPETLK